LRIETLDVVSIRYWEIGIFGNDVKCYGHCGITFSMWNKGNTRLSNILQIGGGKLKYSSE